jgi:hypothetical protein
MKRFMPWVVTPFLALAACDSDEGNNNTDTTDTTQPSDTNDTTQPGVSALTGVNTNVTVTTPTPNASCAANEVDTGTHGAKYPWGGLTAGSTSFTCNKCPGGLQDFQGSFRAHGYAADETTPDYDKGNNAATGDAEVLLIDGNTWYSKFYDKQSDTTQETRGFFMCSQQPEHPNEHLFWVVTEVVDDGGSGLEAGDVLRTDVILSQGADRKLIYWMDDLVGQTYVQIGYCKIGTESGGKTCNDPF